MSYYATHIEIFGNPVEKIAWLSYNGTTYYWLMLMWFVIFFMLTIRYCLRHHDGEQYSWIKIVLMMVLFFITSTDLKKQEVRLLMSEPHSFHSEVFFDATTEDIKRFRHELTAYCQKNTCHSSNVTRIHNVKAAKIEDLQKIKNQQKINFGERVIIFLVLISVLIVQLRNSNDINIHQDRSLFFYALLIVIELSSCVYMVLTL